MFYQKKSINNNYTIYILNLISFFFVFLAYKTSLLKFHFKLLHLLNMIIFFLWINWIVSHYFPQKCINLFTQKIYYNIFERSTYKIHPAQVTCIFRVSKGIFHIYYGMNVIVWRVLFTNAIQTRYRKEARKSSKTWERVCSTQ